MLRLPGVRTAFSPVVISVRRLDRVPRGVDRIRGDEHVDRGVAVSGGMLVDRRPERRDDARLGEDPLQLLRLRDVAGGRDLNEIAHVSEGTPGTGRLRAPR